MGSIVIVGAGHGGLIGLEFLAIARGLGLEVTIVDMADRLTARAVSSHMSDRFLTKHQQMGVTTQTRSLRGGRDRGWVGSGKRVAYCS